MTTILPCGIIYTERERETKKNKPSQKKRKKKMKNWKVWILTDKDGNELARGRKKDVIKVMYPRYVYSHIFTDKLYRTNELLEKAGN